MDYVLYYQKRAADFDKAVPSKRSRKMRMTCVELGEKLKQLRKEHDLTQEKLAEKLFISRTAVSKWESGKGYPNIESLKNISQLFSVSIDDLLSGEEMEQVERREEKQQQENRLYTLIYGLLDILTLVCIFLPFYGQSAGQMIRLVSLIEFNESVIDKSFFLILLLLMIVTGIIELILYFWKKDKLLRYSRIWSLFFHSLVILFFAMARHPYVIVYLFLIFIIKAFLLFKANK
ncbi:helix-turn-helix domain-containing protein [Enterococcus sp. LJL51]|uniref:helix-turn-helix domain-containing protein n=1 Tax=Enterococcus sp. LJL51 TaxID=3416656 RepID=UPI003CE92DC4